MGILKPKLKYYSLTNILSKHAQYNIIFGERSNGKTFATLLYALEQYTTNKKQSAYVRRWKEYFRGKRAESLFNSIVALGYVKKLTNGRFDNVYYTSSKWYLAKWYDKLNKNILDEEPFCYAFSLSDMEHDKSTSYPNITSIIFDEFLTRNSYIPNEFVIFMNVISTIVRDRDDVLIFMLGNTVNQYCPYFNEMGLKHIEKMNKGDIDVYQYGESKLCVAVEYADSPNKSKPSDLYFAFDNPKLQMITNGVWEIALYPHCPVKYKPKNILFTYFINFDNNLLQCEIVQVDNSVFTYIHRKTTPLKHPELDLIYDTEYHYELNYTRRITRPMTKIEKRVAEFFAHEKISYQDNDVGEIIRNYINWSKTETIK